ncbi:MAG: HAD hydrolase-like protein [Candidatus Aminicenantes bacterium]|jgi:HAD superfamily phosphatase|nr:HAD hydrolase-like protein [Candidatus Aminicenantes bacterium]
MLVAFDVDGVLVEVSESYHRALPETISFFLKAEIDPHLPLELKVRLNLNNDWDATLAGLFYYRSGLELKDFISLALPGPPDFRKFYRLAKEMDIDLPEYNLVIKEFERIYRKHRVKEKLRLPPGVLETIRGLSEGMAVITGRTRNDLDHTFKKFALYKYFDYIVTENDLPGVEFRKPSAYPLKYLLKNIRPSFPVCYVGDTLADKQMVENYCQEERQPIIFILFRHQYNVQIESELSVESADELMEVILHLKSA